MIADNVKIIDSDYLDGVMYSATIQINNKYYWVDLVNTIDYGNECMAFTSDKKGNVKNWSELYYKRNIDLTEENFKKCINDFAKQLEGVNHDTQA